MKHNLTGATSTNRPEFGFRCISQQTNVCNAFFLTVGFGYGRWGGHIVLAELTGIQALTAVLSTLF